MSIDQAFDKVKAALERAKEAGPYYGNVTLRIEQNQVTVIDLHQTLK